MDEKTPESYQLLTYLWVVGISALGGLVNFMRKVREGHVRAVNIVELLGELLTSAFAGLLTFWLCESADFDPLLSAVLIAVSGHMGTRAVFLFERYLEARASRLLPAASTETTTAQPEESGQ